MAPSIGCLFVLATFVVSCAHANNNDPGFLDSFKNILFGGAAQQDSQKINATQNHAPMGFHQYNTVSTTSNRNTQPSGQSCTLPRQIGTGPYRIPRWYYNPVRGRCELFYWSGCCGNGNNFQTFQACQATCEVDPCSQEKEPGVGALQLNKYFFNKETRICEQFVYFGSSGNRNNFQILEECQAQCPETPNPCAVSGASLTPCQAGQGCGTGSYCHVGAQSQTTVCCPKPAAVDRCQQPLNVGIGNSNLQRWYFNPLTQQCQQCTYRGLQGNENNFLSQNDCENSCLTNPCKIGTPYRSQGITVQCSAASPTVCPAGHYCHIGADSTTSVCCQALGGDPCGQPMDRGTGGAALSRWYWNQQSQCCLPFNYCGLKGTQNNFLSKQDCDRTCYVYVNVCPTGSPLLDTSSNKPIPCTFGSNSCGSDHWCHLGLVPDEYQCCPGTPTNPGACQGEDYSVGETGAAAPAAERWYYDKSEMQCKQFTYNGRKGNQNNFLTQADCEATCDVFTNPCNQPITLPATQCSSTGTSDTCGANQWCHIGATQDSTVCCPSEGDPCSLPLSRGSGNQFMDRWYYNQQTASCQQFTYSGLHGNQNNFLSQQSCEEKCGPNPCFEGRPFVGADGRTQTCSASANFNTCPLNHWCHIGNDLSTTVCCPGASTNVCNLPMSTGEGNANLERYYYDSNAKTCRPFTYNGLKGNQNNFISLRACQLSCQPLDNPCIGQPATTAAGQVLFCSITNKDSCPVNFWCHIGATPETTVCCPGATNPCSVPLAPGTGNSGLARYYYNPDDRQCLPFQYNGKRGNQNNFESQSECERTCPEQLCLLSIDRGACGGRQTRYAYNRQTSQCVAFEYTGCGGNLNNFVSMADCMSTCGNVGFR